MSPCHGVLKITVSASTQGQMSRGTADRSAPMQQQHCIEGCTHLRLDGSGDCSSSLVSRGRLLVLAAPPPGHGRDQVRLGQPGCHGNSSSTSHHLQGLHMGHQPPCMLPHKLLCMLLWREERVPASRTDRDNSDYGPVLQE